MEKKDKSHKKLGELLILQGKISKGQLKKALDIQKKDGGLIGGILIECGYIDEETVIQTVAVQCNIPYLPLENFELNEAVAGLLPENVARQYKIVPLDIIGDVLTIAMSNPLESRAIEDIEMITHKKVGVFIGKAEAIKTAIDSLYSGKK